MVIPREHGAWGMMLVPLATGAVVASRQGRSFVSLALFLVAAIALFWMRTPVEAWLGTTAIKAQSSAERAMVIRVAIGLAALAAAAVAALFAQGLWRGLLFIGAISAAAFALQALVKRASRAARMPAQIIGALGLTSTAAAAYYVMARRVDRIALALWLANWMFAGDQVHFVQVRMKGSRLRSLAEKVRQAPGFLVGQALLLVVIVALAGRGAFPRLAVLAFIPAIVRGFVWFVQVSKPLDVHKLGFSELRQALVFGALLSASFLL